MLSWRGQNRDSCSWLQMLKPLSGRCNRKAFFVLLMYGLHESEWFQYTGAVQEKVLISFSDDCGNASGRRPTYRDVLLRVRSKLHVPCSVKLSTEDMEAEIFLHLLQDYSRCFASEVCKYLQSFLVFVLTWLSYGAYRHVCWWNRCSQPKKKPQPKRRVPRVPYLDAIERAKGSRFRDNISSAIRLGSEELLTTILKVSFLSCSQPFHFYRFRNWLATKQICVIRRIFTVSVFIMCSLDRQCDGVSNWRLTCLLSRVKIMHKSRLIP